MWFSLFAKKRRTASVPSRRPSFRPRLEALEDRCTPSTVGFSTALPASMRLAVDAPGTPATTYGAGKHSSSGVYKFGPTGQLLASNPRCPGAGGGIAVDSAGDVYLNKLGVITELDPTLQHTLFSLTLPGAAMSDFGGPDPGASANGTIAVAGGKIYAVGAAGAGLPTTANAFQSAFPGAAAGVFASAYVAVIDPSSPAPYHLTYCSYLGGATPVSTEPANVFRGESASGVAVDAAGNVYLTGTTDAADFPTTAGAFQTVNRAGAHPANSYHVAWTTYVAKVDPTQSGAASLAYSTFLGGSGYDGYVTIVGAICQPVEQPGHRCERGRERLCDRRHHLGRLPRHRRGVPDHLHPGPNVWAERELQGGHAYVTELSTDGGHLVFSTLLGGSGWDWGEGITVDAAGNVWVTGATRSSDFPVTAGAIQGHKTSGYDGNSSLPIANAFVVELDPTGTTEKYGTFWGGTADDFGMGIGLDGSGDVIVAGQLSGSGTYPTTAKAYQKSGSGFLPEFHP